MLSELERNSILKMLWFLIFFLKEGTMQRTYYASAVKREAHGCVKYHY